jgi:hypothetical protein
VTPRRHLPGIAFSFATVAATTALTVVLSDTFDVPGNRLDTSKWTTEFFVSPTNNPAFLGRTALRDWVHDPQQGPFVVANGLAELALNRFNPVPGGEGTLFGTHAKSKDPFLPTSTTDVILTARLRLGSVRRGMVYGVYFYDPGDCGGENPPSPCRHDEIDIELVTNFLQTAGQHKVYLNKYQDDPLGAGNVEIVSLPPGFDPLVHHEWKIRWGLNRINYIVDGSLLSSVTDLTHIPQGAMRANINVWAPDGDPETGWPDAFDASLTPAPDAASDEVFVAHVDYVTVATSPATFTDDPLTPSSSVIKASHVNELRTRIDAIRAARGLSGFSWSDNPVVANTTVILVQHLAELRTALNQAYAQAGFSPPQYTDNPLGAGTLVKAIHIAQLRSAVLAIE